LEADAPLVDVAVGGVGGLSGGTQPSDWAGRNGKA
jgi:hypothetical protein